MTKLTEFLKCFLLIMVFNLLPDLRIDAQAGRNDELDRKVKAFLESGPGREGHLNVPPSDGKSLHDIIIENNYKNALEIGTSTGISSIWIAWALSKTGGKLITVEIDESRHKEAIENFKAAGLEKYIDARLADAHELVPQLKGPFDFVFSDADKGWLKNYFLAVDPNLTLNGCFVTHNVSERGGGYSSDYVTFLKQLPHYETSFDNNGAGMSISYKRRIK